MICWWVLKLLHTALYNNIAHRLCIFQCVLFRLYTSSVAKTLNIYVFRAMRTLLLGNYDV